MLETLTLITLATLFLVFFRPGKTPPLESPLTVNLPGQYTATLAPRLNLVAPHLREMSALFHALPKEQVSDTIVHLEVKDPSLRKLKLDNYLLTIKIKDGELSFHAQPPVSVESAGVADLATNTEMAERLLSIASEVGAKHQFEVKMKTA